MKKLLIFFIIAVLSGCDSSLFVGADVSGYLDSNAENSKFGFIDGMDIDKEGNLYVADSINNVIRKITPEGKVSTFAGTGKKGDTLGKKEDAEFNLLSDIKFDNYDNLYIAESYSSKIKKLAKDGIVSILDFPEKDKIGKHLPIIMLFGNNNEFYINFEGLFYEVSQDLKLKEISINIPYCSLVSVNKLTNELYFISGSLSEGGNLTPVTYLYVRKNNGEIEEITQKYKKHPYPDLDPVGINFDSEGNIYISYEKGYISKTSKEGKFIKNYSTSYFQILFSSNSIRMGNEAAYRMVIDNKRKILYYSDKFSIYKININ